MYTGHDISISRVIKKVIINWFPFRISSTLSIQSNSHLFHISSNFLLLHGFQTDVGFSEYLKKQSKLKKLVKS